jgi:glutamate-1-semialdehyde 2,1-aminomutase
MTGILIIARLGSTRLPGKHLIRVGGRPYISWLAERMQTVFGEEMAAGDVQLVICTSMEDQNLAFRELFGESRIQVFFGDRENIPRRLSECAGHFGMDSIVSIDGDDILCSGRAARLTYEALREGKSEFVKTSGLPLGMNSMGFTVHALREALGKSDGATLETGWGRIFAETRQEELVLGSWSESPHLRFTLDYPRDNLFFERILTDWGDRVFGISDPELIAYVEGNRVFEINADLNGEYWQNFNLQLQKENGMDQMMDDYRKRLHSVIPGGAHTYSRGDDQFPSTAPSILDRGEGAYVFDPGGRKFLDYGMGLRSVNIGYGNKEIADASYAEILKGNNLTRASTTELLAAELLCEIIPSVEMVKFAKHGSTVTTAAVKLARGFTGRKYIAVPAEQPFFSFDDWFIGSTVITRGIPLDSREWTLKFHYNDIQSLQELFDQYPSQIAGVIMEAVTTAPPQNGFLQGVRDLCTRNGSLFILDEMITGFRWHLGGAQTYFRIDPDLCTFGKAMANGFAVSALCGKREFMKIGGIEEEGAERLFLTSTTHGAEMSALGAFMKTVEILGREKVIPHFWQYGEDLIAGMNGLAREWGIGDHFLMEGYPCSPHFTTKNADGDTSLEFRTLFAQEMAANGVLMPYVALSFSHQAGELERTLEAGRKALKVYRDALQSGIKDFLHSKAIKPVFRKYN